MEVENGALEDNYPLQTGGFPLPCDVFVRVYLVYIKPCMVKYMRTARRSPRHIAGIEDHVVHVLDAVGIQNGAKHGHLV